MTPTANVITHNLVTVTAVELPSVSKAAIYDDGSHITLIEVSLDGTTFAAYPFTNTDEVYEISLHFPFRYIRATFSTGSPVLAYREYTR